MIITITDLAAHPQRQCAILAIHATTDVISKQGFTRISPEREESLLGHSSHQGFARLSALIFLVDNANELLCVNVLPGVCVDEVQLTRDILVCELVPGFRQ